MNRLECFFLEFVLENFETIELQIAFNVFTLKIFRVFSYFFWCNRKNSKSSWCILLQNFMVALRYWRLGHYLKHDLGGALAIAEVGISSNTVRRNNAHSLNIRIELKSPVNNSLVISSTRKWKYDIRIVLWKI